MRLCTLRIGIHFMKDSGFRALVGLRDPFDDLFSDLGSASPFFRDELLAPVLHFVSVDREERELRGKRIVT
ncbi:hypothetical protein VNO78_37612 [Psophocarpus tetragonolobus]|uniref:Uncharacterized protein n=1 Tax=Psophocarpus tetragonolobus TaxID=3891 RepID=A0AAN9NCF9_PSOTE